MQFSDQKTFLEALRAKVYWPRRYSKGVAILKCNLRDVTFVVNDFSDLMIGGYPIRVQASDKCSDSVVISGLNRGITEAEVFEVLSAAGNMKLVDLILERGNFVENPPIVTCEEALQRGITPFMPKQIPYVNSVRVQVLQLEPKDVYTKAFITFDGTLHLEATKALEHIDGKVLPGCLPWQKIPARFSTC